jgi:hypothetical protein
MTKQWLVVAIAAIFAASFFLPSIDGGTRGPHPELGWVAAALAAENLGHMFAHPHEELESLRGEASPMISFLGRASLSVSFLANVWFLGACVWWAARGWRQCGRRLGPGLAFLGLMLAADAWMLALPVFEFRERLLFGYHVWAVSVSALFVITALQVLNDCSGNSGKTKEQIMDSP